MKTIDQKEYNENSKQYFYWFPCILPCDQWVNPNGTNGLWQIKMSGDWISLKACHYVGFSSPTILEAVRKSTGLNGIIRCCSLVKLGIEWSLSFSIQEQIYFLLDGYNMSFNEAEQVCHVKINSSFSPVLLSFLPKMRPSSFANDIIGRYRFGPGGGQGQFRGTMTHCAGANCDFNKVKVADLLALTSGL